eukprot:CAMPEP_0170456058 /NCGR_PEP_ID=MMETSP0123-20130129/3821_1 /TAXON_ID=182087 /ORGANISM="Favella ehrenbergii, Strain Fehren 1" /LENGTH=67 /DNA_ID=CAMNT_0010719413 /DNA_START=767 /DNA_END=970 /DNA_ORIENTATION=+
MVLLEAFLVIWGDGRPKGVAWAASSPRVRICAELLERISKPAPLGGFRALRLFGICLELVEMPSPIC